MAELVTLECLDDFDIGKKLGKGRFGRVYLARENKTTEGLLFAIKVLNKSMLEKNKCEDNFKAECEIHLRLKHPNIITLYKWSHDAKRIYLVMEYALNGNLYEKIETEGRLSNEQSATYARQVTNALIYLQSLNIVHRDLKPENVLIGAMDEIKLADFGWSFVYNADGSNQIVAGTIDYLPPEMISKVPYDMKIDNWCLGVLIFEMLTGITPFHHSDMTETTRLISSAKYKYPKGIKITTEAKSLISKLLVKNSNERLNFEDVLTCKWFDLYANKDDKYIEYFNKIHN